MSSDEITFSAGRKFWSVAGLNEIGVERLSASSISMFQRCPRSWAYRYVLGLKSPPDAGLVTGSGMHYAAEVLMGAKVVTGENPDPSDAAEIAHDYAAEELATGEVITDGAEHEANILDRTARLGSLWAEYAAPGVNPAKVETTFTVELGGVPVMGRLDVITREGTVVDWKSAKRSPAPGDVGKKVQTELYAAATEMPVEFIYVVDSPRVQKVVPVALSREEIAQARMLAGSTVADTAAAMASGAWPRNRDGWHCSKKWCGYYDRCMSGRDDATLNDLGAAARAAAESTKG